jgi:hypothetical protein
MIAAVNTVSGLILSAVESCNLEMLKDKSGFYY